MTVLDREKERASRVESYLDLWAKTVRGNVDLGYPHITAEAAAIFGKGRAQNEWPEEVHEVECAMQVMPGEVRIAMVSFYVRRRHINSIGRELHCSQRKVSGLLDTGRTFVDAWMRGRMAA